MWSLGGSRQSHLAIQRNLSSASRPEGVGRWLWGLRNIPQGKAEHTAGRTGFLGQVGSSLREMVSALHGRGTATAHFPLTLSFQKISWKLLQVKRVPTGLCWAVRRVEWARATLLTSSSVLRELLPTTWGDRREDC